MKTSHGVSNAVLLFQHLAAPGARTSRCDLSTPPRAGALATLIDPVRARAKGGSPPLQYTPCWRFSRNNAILTVIPSHRWKSSYETHHGIVVVGSLIFSIYDWGWHFGDSRLDPSLHRCHLELLGQDLCGSAAERSAGGRFGRMKRGLQLFIWRIQWYFLDFEARHLWFRMIYIDLWLFFVTYLSFALFFIPVAPCQNAVMLALVMSYLDLES